MCSIDMIWFFNNCSVNASCFGFNFCLLIWHQFCSHQITVPAVSRPHMLRFPVLEWHHQAVKYHRHLSQLPRTLQTYLNRPSLSHLYHGRLLIHWFQMLIFKNVWQLLKRRHQFHPREPCWLRIHFRPPSKEQMTILWQRKKSGEPIASFSAQYYMLRSIPERWLRSVPVAQIALFIHFVILLTSLLSYERGRWPKCGISKQNFAISSIVWQRAVHTEIVGETIRQPFLTLCWGVAVLLDWKFCAHSNWQNDYNPDNWHSNAVPTCTTFLLVTILCSF